MEGIQWSLVGGCSQDEGGGEEMYVFVCVLCALFFSSYFGVFQVRVAHIMIDEVHLQVEVCLLGGGRHTDPNSCGRERYRSFCI